MGAAGMLWALHHLGAGDQGADGLHAAYLAQPDWPGAVPGLWVGEAGILLVAQQLVPSAEGAERLLEAVTANVGNESKELMWGAPGTMLAARWMLDATGDRRWADAWMRSADILWSRWEPSPEHGCHLWTQRLYDDARR